MSVTARDATRADGVPSAHVALVAPRLVAFVWGTGLVMLVGTVGADARWLAVLGRDIVHSGRIPDGVPFATAPSSGWHNVPVLAEILFGWFAHGGDRGFIAAQAVAVGLTLAILSGKGRAQWPALLVVPVALFPVIAVARVSLFSLPLFVLLAALLRREAARPSRAIWLVVPYTAIWSNLHGAALVGAGLVLAYLLFDAEGHGWPERIALGAATTAALFATPALWQTGVYYLHVLRSAPARQRIGLWESLSPTSGFAWLLVAGVVVLLVTAWPRLLRYERIATIALALATVRSERVGVWLVLLVAAPAAEAGRRMVAGRRRRLSQAAVLGAGLACLVLGIARTPETRGSGPAVRRALELARGGPILATSVLAERVALAGGRVWVSDPIDAFRFSDQTVYVDWSQGKPEGDGALAHANVILVDGGNPARARLLRNPAVRRVAESDGTYVFVKRAQQR
ncbi:MAG TPA: hypothetical protein VH416_02795 [Gaiellaceae bacterium]